MIWIQKQSPVPLHYQLRKALEEQILSGQLAPGVMLPTEEQLCAELGISRTTVRRAILDLVQQGLLERRAAVGTFVSENRKSRNTIVIVAFGIGPLSATVGTELFFRLWDGIAAAAHARHLQVVARRADVLDENSARLFSDIMADPDNLGVAIFTWREVTKQHVVALHNASFPYVLLNRYVPNAPIPAVTLDDYSGVKQAVQKLYGLGHQRITFLGIDNAESTAHAERQAAYIHTMMALGLADMIDIRLSGWSESDARQVAQTVLQASSMPTAILATSGLLAAGTVTEAQARGLQVPRDLSVIGIEDSSRVTDITPRITTIDYAPQRFGELVVDLVCRQAAGDQTARNRQMVSTTLIERESCAPPRRENLSHVTTKVVS